jgi:hypothetical protein
VHTDQHAPLTPGEPGKAPAAEGTSLIRLLGTLGQIDTGTKLISWVNQDLQPVFPHGAFLCGMGKVHRAGISPIKFFSASFEF